jgi:hypothetical protein
MTASKKDNPGCLSIFLPFLRGSQKAPVARRLPYRVRDDFLSPAEFSFYKVLSGLVGTHLTIQSKVRLADIFFVSRPNGSRSSFNKISQKHLDFLVCEPVTMKPVLGIELDDSSHQRSSRQRRDNFVVQVFKDAGLPLLRFPARSQYNSREIADQIRPLLKNIVHASASEAQQESVAPVSEMPVCTKCGIPMILRTVAQGEHKGKQFYGCQNFPRCRSVKPYLI